MGLPKRGFISGKLTLRVSFAWYSTKGTHCEFIKNVCWMFILTMKKAAIESFCTNEQNLFFKSETHRIFIRYSLNKFADRFFVNFKLAL